MLWGCRTPEDVRQLSPIRQWDAGKRSELDIWIRWSKLPYVDWLSTWMGGCRQGPGIRENYCWPGHSTITFNVSRTTREREKERGGERGGEREKRKRESSMGYFKYQYVWVNRVWPTRSLDRIRWSRLSMVSCLFRFFGGVVVVHCSNKFPSACERYFVVQLTTSLLASEVEFHGGFLLDIIVYNVVLLNQSRL